MTMIEILVLGGFGLPIAALCMFFAAAAGRMAREEKERERIRREAEQARRRRARYIPAGARAGVCR